MHVYHQYTIRVPGHDRDAFAAQLSSRGIGTGVFYPVPNHELSSLSRYAVGVDLPHTRLAAAECLSLPVHPSLSAQDLERIIEAVNDVAKAGA
jgi:dTDP-4-amino-4,6-dideoxygalactose transaminase